MQVIVFPGQGAQFRGMGRELFRRYPTQVKSASEILGYSIEELCLVDSENKLSNTEYTQPALYVVNALAYYDLLDSKDFTQVDYFAGHSLGEYNALLAADAFSFEEGLELVKLRGQLMAAAKGGGMAAVLGLHADDVTAVLQQGGLSNVELANFNTPTQLVLSGPTAEIAEAEKLFTRQSVRCVILNVGAAFHSKYMLPAQEIFNDHLEKCQLRDPRIPVIANRTARPYGSGQVTETLGAQISSSVLWMDSVIYLLAQGDLKFVEIGSSILTKMIDEISKTCGLEIETMKRVQVQDVASALVTTAPQKYFQAW